METAGELSNVYHIALQTGLEADVQLHSALHRAPETRNRSTVDSSAVRQCFKHSTAVETTVQLQYTVFTDSTGDSSATNKHTTEGIVVKI